MPEASKTRVVFMGTPVFAETMLRSLAEAHYDIVAVFTQPDKPSGRNQEVIESPVKLFAASKNIPIEQPGKLDDLTMEKFRSYSPDIVIVAAYGKILPEKMLAIPPFGCINIHASLLPRWRGASPVHNAILAGDTETGITIMQMDAGMDTGPILATKSLPIAPLDTTTTLLPKLASLGSEILLSTLSRWIKKEIEATPQDASKATLCQLIEREDGKIFWSESAETLFNRYRALSSWPGVFSFWRKDGSLLRLKFHEISLQRHSPETQHSLGQVFEIGDSIGIQTGKGVIIVQMIQMEGKSPTPIADFIRGYPDFIGSVLE